MPRHQPPPPSRVEDIDELIAFLEDLKRLLSKPDPTPGDREAIRHAHQAFLTSHPYTIGSARKQIEDRVEAAYPTPNRPPYKRRR